MHLNHISTQLPCLGCVNLVLSLCVRGGITQKTAVSRTVNMISAELNASWLLTGNILKFMKCSSLSPTPKQMNCQTLGAGQRHSVHISWWHLTGEHRGPVPPAHLLEQKGKKPQTEVLAALTIAASPARRTDYKKSLWKSQLLLGVVAAVSVNGIKMNLYPVTPTTWASWVPCMC